MDKYSDVRDQAYHFFIQEVPNLLQELENGLLEIKQTRSTHQIHTLMRLAHTLKGGSAAVGLNNITQIAHKLEDYLRTLYNEDLSIDQELKMLFLAAYDCLRTPLEESIRLGQAIDTQEHLNNAEVVFAQLEQKLEGFLGGVDRLSTAAEYGVDIVRSIFEVDIEEGLQRLEKIQTEPSNFIAGELRAQAQVFLGIADLVDTSVLEEIASLVIQILDRFPETANQLLPLALLDFRSVQKAFLEGTTSTNILSPSPALQNFLSQQNTAEVFLDFEETTSSIEEERILSLEDMFEETTSSIEEERILSLEDMFEETTSSIEEERILSLEDMFEETTSSIEEERILSLEDRISQIKEDFSTLQSIDLDEIIEIPVKIKDSFTVTPVSATLEPEISVRLEISRLESMNNQLGELSINRSRLAIQHENIKAALNELSNRFVSFKEIEPKLKNVLDKLSIAPIKSNSNLHSQFDVLELDNYSAGYEILQYAVEQLIQLEEALEDAILYTERSTESIDKQKQILNYVQNDFLRARMLPLGNILSRFPRILYDLSANYQKPVELILQGTDTLTDKAVLEKLYDPLLHIIRNAFDHGIESPEERQALGKPPQGHISIEAYSRGNRTFIQIKDDGRGIDPEKIRAKATELNIISKETAQTISSKNQLFDFLFRPGFSTTNFVTELSGRGMGLDIVRSQITSLKGDIYIDSTINRGTVFTISLPTTLTMAKLLVINVENTLFAISSQSIEQILVPLKEQIKTSGGHRFFFWQEQLIPIYSLSELLRYDCPPRAEIQYNLVEIIPQSLNWLKPLLIFAKDGQLTALEIDQIITEEELVIKPLNTILKTPEYIYGCTIIGEGTLVPVVDGISLLNKRERNSPVSSASISSIPLPQLTQEDDVILIVDDSAGMRQTLTLTLEKFGYRHLQASDGRVALEKVQRESHQIKLIICDIEMPNMNGFEFLTHRRTDPVIKKIPVIMLTSRSSDKHRNLAFKLGASAYITKPYLEMDLIEQINKLKTSDVQSL